MKLPLIESELRELTLQQGISLPPVARRERATPKRAANLSPDLKRIAQQAIASYRGSSDFQNLMSNLDSLNLEQLHSRLALALHSPHFVQLKESLRNPAAFDIDLGEFIPKAISIGLLGQIVLGVGVGISVGYIENLDLSQTAIYLGGAVDFGVDAGIEGDVCVGFWKNAVDDMSGVYTGAELDVDDEIGVTAAYFEQDEEPALVLVAADFGADDGFEDSDYYIFHIDTGSNPIYQPGDAQYFVQLLWLTCVNSKDNWDTVKFTFTQDDDDTEYHFPAWDGYQMAESQQDGGTGISTWNVGAILKFNKKIVLTLQVGDHTMPSVTIWPTDFGGSTTTPNPNPYVFSDTVDGFNDINYSLTAQLIKD